MPGHQSVPACLSCGLNGHSTSFAIVDSFSELFLNMTDLHRAEGSDKHVGHHSESGAPTVASDVSGTGTMIVCLYNRVRFSGFVTEDRSNVPFSDTGASAVSYPLAFRRR